MYQYQILHMNKEQECVSNDDYMNELLSRIEPNISIFACVLGSNHPLTMLHELTHNLIARDS
jgi:hypothetical protein